MPRMEAQRIASNGISDFPKSPVSLQCCSHCYNLTEDLLVTIGGFGNEDGDDAGCVASDINISSGKKHVAK